MGKLVVTEFVSVDGVFDRLKLNLAKTRTVGSDGVQIQIYQRVE